MQRTNKAATQSRYLILEPVTGLYAVIEGSTSRLVRAKHASKFQSFEAAAEAAGAARLTEQPHELVRVDAL